MRSHIPASTHRNPKIPTLSYASGHTPSGVALYIVIRIPHWTPVEVQVVCFGHRMDQTLISTPAAADAFDLAAAEDLHQDLRHIRLDILSHIVGCSDTPCIAAVVAVAAARPHIHHSAGRRVAAQMRSRAGRVFLYPVVEPAEKRILSRRHSVAAGTPVRFHSIRVVAVGMLQHCKVLVVAVAAAVGLAWKNKGYCYLRLDWTKRPETTRSIAQE